jgi:hypothetical protein
MDELNNSTLICENCSNAVKAEDDFCPECGTLFIDEIFCDIHNDISAEGVCIICSLPFCNKCGVTANNHFLCNPHSNYEIYESMVRVYGTLNDVTAQHAKSCLEQDGLHPILFFRHHSYLGPRFAYSLFGAEGDYRGNIVNEIKVMVPTQEVLKAEEILKSLKILE